MSETEESRRPVGIHDLSDRVAVVTGASRGIGAAIAESLLEAGATVVLAVRSAEPVVESLAEPWSERFGRAVPVVAADVLDDAAVADVYRTVFKQFKRLDILVNNAGIMQEAPIGMTPVDLVDRVVGTNLTGTIHHCRHAARLMMRKKSGSIVNLSSIVALTGGSGQAVYSASKAGILGLTRSLAKELGPSGVRVNAVAPGFIETDLTAHYDEEKRHQIAEGTALRRLGRATDIAHAVTFLASDAAAFITGQTLGVDGGMVV